jgi:hypothetical protein
MVQGRVLDDTGPVATATVRIQGTSTFTTSEADGTFDLGVPDTGSHALTAWAVGYFCGGPVEVTGGQGEIELVLQRHPTHDNEGYEWVSAFAAGAADRSCEACHSEGGGPESLLPFDEWVLDAHSQSARNPRFLNMYAGTDMAGIRSPLTRRAQSRDYGPLPLRPSQSDPYVGPGYRLDFPATAGNCGACHTPAAAVDAPYEIDPRLVTGVGAEGVACDFCHKVWDVRLGEDGLPSPDMPGVMSFELRRPPEGHQFFAGPFDDVAPGEDTYSPLQRESRFCAPCHHGVFWGVTVYNSYGEWLESPYSDPDDGKTCQDCHMPSRGSTHFARIDKGGLIRDPNNIASHRMPGANDVELLQNTVELDVSGERIGDELVVTTTVTNTEAGHHVPTGSPLRQVFLVVVVRDALEETLPLRSGPILPDWAGDLEGQPGTYYAKILQEIWTNLAPTGAYWLPTRITEDTRLPAFQADTNRFVFSAPAQGEAEIEVSVLFRRAFFELMQWKGWTDPDILMERTVLRGI